MTVDLFLYFVAFLLLLLAAFGVTFRRVAFGWLGLASPSSCSPRSCCHTSADP